MNKPTGNPFRKRRGQPSWSSPKVMRQNSRRARIAHKGLAPTTEQAHALIAEAIAAGRVKLIPARKRTH